MYFQGSSASQSFQPQTSLSFEGLSERHFKCRCPLVPSVSPQPRPKRTLSHPSLGSPRAQERNLTLPTSSCFLPQPSTAGKGEMGPRRRWVVGTREKKSQSMRATRQHRQEHSLEPRKSANNQQIHLGLILSSLGCTSLRHTKDTP